MKIRILQIVILLYFSLTITAQQVTLKDRVYLADSYGKIADRTLIGDNLGDTIFAKSYHGGIELNEEVVKQHLHPSDKTYFEPTTQWDLKRSHDRIFS